MGIGVVVVVGIICAALAAHDPEQALDDAAMAAMRAQDVDRAEQLAVPLLHGRFRGDAHLVLSYVAFAREHLGDAASHAATAFAIHVLAGHALRAARDVKQLSNAARAAGKFAAAQIVADEALAITRRVGDHHEEVSATIAYADVLRRVGATDEAQTLLADAPREVDAPRDQAWLDLKLAMTYMEAEHTHWQDRAWDALGRAAAANRLAGTTRAGADAQVDGAIAANAVMLLRHRDPALAWIWLDQQIAADDEAAELFLERGYLNADRGALAEADRDLDRAESLPPPDADWPWEFATAHAELAELRGGPLGDWLAELHYRRAIAMVRELRSHARAHSAFLVASHRAPYDGLISLLAREGRWRDALTIVIELDASDMLRATGNAVAGSANGARDIPSSGVAAPAPPAPSVDAVLAAWRGRDLVIAIAPSRRQIAPGRERAYRMRLAGGEVTGEDIGDAGRANELAAYLHEMPGDRAAGAALGAMLIPSGSEADTLDVLAIGALGKAPLSSLRDPGGAQVLARRPLARVLALAATGPDSAGAGGDVILADALGDLSGAAQEGTVVARALGPSARIAGAEWPTQADGAQLWAARDAALLHIANHVDRVRSALLLADGDVTADEILERGVAPRLAVLAGCGSEAARDEEGWGSIAAAMLASGTVAVIATDRSVDDKVSLAVMRAFYARPDWRSDPERALAAVQVAFDTHPPADLTANPAAEQHWMAFSVLRRPPVVPR